MVGVVKSSLFRVSVTSQDAGGRRAGGCGERKATIEKRKGLNQRLRQKDDTREV